MGTLTAVVPGAGRSPRALLVDITRCIGCRACAQACKETHAFPGTGEETELDATTYTVVLDKGDDRYLSAMTQRVFQAGMQHAVVDAKWPEFELAFQGFDPEAMARLGPGQIEDHMQNGRIIRDRAKLRTIPENARFILEIRQERGAGFGACLLVLWRADRQSRI